jgi:hypothetical protein
MSGSCSTLSIYYFRLFKNLLCVFIEAGKRREKNVTSSEIFVARQISGFTFFSRVKFVCVHFPI